MALHAAAGVLEVVPGVVLTVARGGGGGGAGGGANGGRRPNPPRQTPAPGQQKQAQQINQNKTIKLIQHIRQIDETQQST